MTGRVTLIAHRGQPEKFPENSLQGFAHVLENGAAFVETDVHLTLDGVAVLSHDSHLLKLAGKQIILADHSYDDISNISAGYADRFGDQFSDFRIATLQQFVNLLKSWPEVTCFIELKEAALNNFGMKAVDLIMQELSEIRSQIIFISFNCEAVLYSKQHYPEVEIGWVLPEWTEENHTKAAELAPRYLFVDTDLCPQQQSALWPGVWEWAVYTVNTAQDVEHYAGLGIEMIETNRYSELKQESKIVDVSNDF